MYKVILTAHLKIESASTSGSFEPYLVVMMSPVTSIKVPEQTQIENYASKNVLVICVTSTLNATDINLRNIMSIEVMTIIVRMILQVTSLLP